MAATTTTSTTKTILLSSSGSGSASPLETITQQQQQQHHHSIQMLHHSAISGGMPHGLGLLTTVASLPPKYRSRYLSINTKCETPLDLSVKPFSPQIANDVPIATSFTEVYTEPSNEPEISQTQIQIQTKAQVQTQTQTTPTTSADQEDEEDEEGEEYTTLTNASYETLETIEVAAHTVVITTEPIVQEAAAAAISQKSSNLINQRIIVGELATAKATPMTPPPTPTKRKLIELCSNDDDGGTINIINNNNNNNNSNNNNPSTKINTIIEPEIIVERIIADSSYTNPTKMAKTIDNPTTKRDSTPVKPIRATDSAPKTIKAQPPVTKPSKNKATRKLKFDEETSSPVSGTIIRPLEDITDGTIQYSNGDIDPKYNIVEITEETKAELAAIKNVIGDYICKLCRLKFDDAFGLAQHRCACIVLLEYRCPECGKQFNCPANLASHRRWHKPKKENNNNTNSGNGVAKKENRNTTNARPTATTTTKKTSTTASAATTTTSKSNISLGGGAVGEISTFSCDECGKKFKRQAYLRKHQLTHQLAGGGEGTKKNALKTTKIIATSAVCNISSNNGNSSNNGGIISYQSYNGSSSLSLSSSSSSVPLHSSSSSSSLHSYSGASSHVGSHEDDVASAGGGVGAVYVLNNVNVGNVAHYNRNYDYDDDCGDDSMSDCSNSSTGYGRLQIVESGLTEEENIAAAALTNLRNCASVIQHTTLAH